MNEELTDKLIRSPSELVRWVQRVADVLRPFEAEECTWSLHVPDTHVPLIRGEKDVLLQPASFNMGDLRAAAALFREIEGCDDD